MLFSRRNQDAKALLQDATRASSRVAEQAQQALSGIADDSRTLAHTARSELGDLSREVRDQASGKVTRARRRTARKLNEAAAAVEPGEKRHRGRSVLKAALAAVAGWAVVNVARKARQKADESSTESDAGEPERSATTASSGTGTSSGTGAKEGKDGKDAKEKAATTGTTSTSTKAKPTTSATAGKPNSSGS
jgi:hypothetical protein